MVASSWFFTRTWFQSYPRVLIWSENEIRGLDRNPRRKEFLKNLSFIKSSKHEKTSKAYLGFPRCFVRKSVWFCGGLKIKGLGFGLGVGNFH